jgi:hypothetical protein
MTKISTIVHNPKVLGIPSVVKSLNMCP